MSEVNYAIVAMAMANEGYKGEPYVDVKTFKGWLEEGRVVKKGEKCFVSVRTYIEVQEKNMKTEDGNKETNLAGSRTALIPRTSYLFHRDQTTEVSEQTKKGKRNA